MKNELIVTQSFELINSRYKVNEYEAKIIMLAISQIYKDDDEFKTYDLKISEISKALDSQQNHKQLKKVAESLLSKPLFIEDNNGWIGFNWFSSIRYIKDEAVLQVSIDPKLKPYLLQLKDNFKSYDIKNIIKLSSSYAIRIYQLLKQYQKIGNRILNVNDMQEMFKVPKSMFVYNNFKQKVLAVAVEQINEHTDLTISYEEIKTGRKITDLNFIIKTKKKAEIQTSALIEVEPTELPQIIKLVKGICGFSNEQTFYQPFTDGSFNLLKEDGSKMFFKSEKQLKRFMDEPASYKYN